jgi:asparagine synthase (glutamine-hydrolysing)
MRERMIHRGPDDAGIVCRPGIGLAARRLAILDLSRNGRMPMSARQGRYWIVYNGEVYNLPVLRALVRSRGHRLRSRTDTEVVLQLYADEGPAMLDRLNGMFALAIWDDQQRQLFLARDRLGIKPLYYVRHDGALYFASEPKAFWEAGVPRQFDPSSWEQLLCYRAVSGEQTVFRGVNRLLPGHWALHAEGRLRIDRWWNLADRAVARREESTGEHAERFRGLLDQAVADRHQSDVPVGILLSGGIDSGSIAASSAEQVVPAPPCYTMRFDDCQRDEGPRALAVARRYGLELHEERIPAEQLLDRLQEVYRFADEPLAHGSDIHLLALSRLAGKDVRVLLSGEGADELLGGYLRYRPLYYPWLLSCVGPVAGRTLARWGRGNRWKRLGRFLAQPGIRAKVLHNAAEIYPDELRRIGMSPSGEFPFHERVLGEAASLYPKQPVRQAMYLDQHTYLCSILDRNDRMTMAASVECRTPFLDHRLVEGVAALPSPALWTRSLGKQLLRNSVGSRLPKSVLTHPKLGFSVPYSHYLRRVDSLRDVVLQLPGLAPICDGPFDKKRLGAVLRNFLAGDDRYQYLVRQLVMIAVWYGEAVNAKPEAGNAQDRRPGRGRITALSC